MNIGIKGMMDNILTLHIFNILLCNNGITISATTAAITVRIIHRSVKTGRSICALMKLSNIVCVASFIRS